MKILSDLADLAKIRQRVYLAIGAFDGVHLGHQAVLRAAREDAVGAKADAVRSGSLSVAVAMTFDPLPAKVLRPDTAPLLLTSTSHKLALIATQGMEATLVQRFDLKFAAIPPRAFLSQIFSAVKEGGELREICVGHNFRFGHNRAGDAEFIVKMGGELGFAVKVIEPVKVANEVVSSTAVRRVIVAGDFKKAAEMLGRSYTIWGTVTRGSGRGEKIGFPTANVDVGEEMLPAHGVYAVRARLRGDDAILSGVANIGIRPTFEKVPVARVLEVHLFNFAKKIYGAPIEVEFAQKLREEKKFESAEALREQIKRDVVAARELLG